MSDDVAVWKSTRLLDTEAATEIRTLWPELLRAVR